MLRSTNASGLTAYGRSAPRLAIPVHCPLARQRLLDLGRRAWRVAAGALPLLFLVPAAAHAVSTSDIKVSITDPTNSDAEVDAIGIRDCLNMATRELEFSGTIASAPTGEETRKYLYITGDGNECTEEELRNACDGIETADDPSQCYCVVGVAEADTRTELSKTARLADLLPTGTGICQGGEETKYALRLLFIGTVTAEVVDAGSTEKDAGTSAADASSGTSGSIQSNPFTLEVDLAPPLAPDGTFSVESGDHALILVVPDMDANDVDHYWACWSADPGFTFTPEGGSSGNLDAGVSVAATCGAVQNNDRLTMRDLTVNKLYTVRIGGVDNAGNAGPDIVAGQNVPVEYLDFAEYYRLMRGTETGGCAALPGTATRGAAAVLVLGGVLLGLRLRRRRPAGDGAAPPARRPAGDRAAPPARRPAGDRREP